MITIELIKTLNPCKDRLDNAIKYYKGRSFTKRQFMGLKNISHEDKLWVSLRLVSKENIALCVADIAESVLHIFEDRYPNDDKPRKAIEAARSHNKNLVISAEGYAASYAAYADSYAAYAASYPAARSADAARAAYAASHAAYAASHAAYAASYAAARSAAAPHAALAACEAAYAAYSAATYAASATAYAARAAYAAADSYAARDALKDKEKLIRKIILKYWK